MNHKKKEIDRIEAIKIVLDKFYSGQQKLFDKMIAQSIHEELDHWLVTVYQNTIFKTVTIVTYRVDKNKTVAEKEVWVSDGKT